LVQLDGAFNWNIRIESRVFGECTIVKCNVAK
jgi:hypothetical protein